MAKILLVDDDRTARAAFRALLESEGHEVCLAKNGEEAVSAFGAAHPDLVLLDVMMPKKNGLVTCSELRARDAHVPIIFITAMPSDVSLVRGLGLGADDYIAKDRSPEELLARIGAALRRRATAQPTAPVPVVLGDADIDLHGAVASVGGETVRLTKSEVDFLQLLLSSRGRVFSPEEIFAGLRGEGYVGDVAAIRSMVLRLKRKLGRGGNLIVSERGFGYRLVK